MKIPPSLQRIYLQAPHQQSLWRRAAERND